MGDGTGTGTGTGTAPVPSNSHLFLRPLETSHLQQEGLVVFVAMDAASAVQLKLLKGKFRTDPLVFVQHYSPSPSPVRGQATVTGDNIATELEEQESATVIDHDNDVDSDGRGDDDARQVHFPFSGVIALKLRGKKYVVCEETAGLEKWVEKVMAGGEVWMLTAELPVETRNIIFAGANS